MKMVSVLSTAFVLTFAANALAGTFSGFIILDSSGCRLIWGEKNSNATCEYVKDQNGNYVRVHFEALKLTLPPICTLTPVAKLKKTGGNEALTLAIGEFNAEHLDIDSIGNELRPVGPLGTIICSSENIH